MKLLPCPMCGGEAVLLDYEARYGGLHYASRCPQCTSCGCSMGYLPTAKKAVEAWNCRASMPAPEKAPSFDDARRKLIHCIEQWDGETEYDAEDIAALADDILDVFASPPAREEAPAERAGEREEIARIIDPAAFLFAQDELMKGDPSQFNALSKADRIIAALRNRTSEPEAGAVRGEVSDAWAERFCEAVNWSPDGQECKTVEGQLRCVSFRELAKGYILSVIATDPCGTHPAPATADKLREAAGLLNDCIWLDTDTGDYRVEHDGSVEKARAILAALNEQPQ